MPRVRKPDNVHKINGTYRKDRHGDPDLKMEFENELDSTPPEWLGEYGQAEWMRQTNMFKGSQILLENSRALMELYCILYHQIRAQPLETTAAMHSNARSYLRMLGQSPTDSGRLIRPKQSKGGSRFVREEK